MLRCGAGVLFLCPWSCPCRCLRHCSTACHTAAPHSGVPCGAVRCRAVPCGAVRCTLSCVFRCVLCCEWWSCRQHHERSQSAVNEFDKKWRARVVSNLAVTKTLRDIRHLSHSAHSCTPKNNPISSDRAVQRSVLKRGRILPVRRTSEPRDAPPAHEKKGELGMRWVRWRRETKRLEKDNPTQRECARASGFYHMLLQRACAAGLATVRCSAELPSLREMVLCAKVGQRRLNIHADHSGILSYVHVKVAF